MKFQDAPFKKQNLLGKLSIIAFLLVTFFILAGMLNSTALVYAQNTEIEKQLNKTARPKKNKSGAVEKSKNEATKPKPKPKVATLNKSKNTNSSVNKVEERLPVTFRTGAVAVEIWSDGRQLGMSDKTGKLLSLLSSGEHSITARKYDQDLIVSTKISVSSDQNTFDFSSDIARAVDEFRQAQAADNTSKNVEPAPVDADAILKSYRDPQTKESVALKDWQAIYDQCRQQAAIGNTDNKLEALCSFAQGQIELSLGNRQKAVSLFSAAVIFLPNSPILHYGLGVAQQTAGNTVEATNSFVKTIQLDSKFALAYKELGKIYQAQNRTREAANYFQQAQTLGDKTPDLRLKIAETQIKNKNCAAAVKELEILQTEAPSADVLIALSDCYVEQKRSVSAIEVLTKAIQLDPKSAFAQYRIGVIYLKQKEFGKAKESLERAQALDAEGKTVDRKELQTLIGKAKKRASN